MFRIGIEPAKGRGITLAQLRGGATFPVTEPDLAEPVFNRNRDSPFRAERLREHPATQQWRGHDVIPAGHGANRVQCRGPHAQHVLFGGVRIGDKPPVDHI